MAKDTEDNATPELSVNMEKKKIGEIIKQLWYWPFMGLVAGFIIGTLIAKFGPDFIYNTQAVTTREDSVFNRVNSKRNQQGVRDLTFRDRLYDCAKKHSNRMADEGKIFHSSNLGDCVSDSWRLLGENVGRTSSGGDIVGAWMNSCGHRDNIVEYKYTHHAVAMVQKNGVEYWTSIFGDYDADDRRSTTIMNGCFDRRFEGKEKWSTVRELGNWFHYHDEDGAIYRTSYSTDACPDINYAQSSVVLRDGSKKGCVLYTRDPASGIVSGTQMVYVPAVKKSNGSRYTYTLSGYSYWLTGSNPQSLYLDFLDSDYKRVGRKIANAAVGSSGWRSVSTGAVAVPNDTRYIRAIIYGAIDHKSSYRWDDVILNRQ